MKQISCLSPYYLLPLLLAFDEVSDIATLWTSPPTLLKHTHTHTHTHTHIYIYILVVSPTVGFKPEGD